MIVIAIIASLAPHHAGATPLLGPATSALAPAGKFPTALAVADLDVDGDMDIVAASESTGIVRSILARGDGTYSSPYSRTLAAGIGAIALADFDGDGKPDLAATLPATGAIVTCRGHGDGSFEAPVSIAVSSLPRGIAVADMNGDGKLDIVVGFASAAQVAVLRGNGNGSFMAAISSGPSQARCIGLGDLNHDGKIDLFAVRPVDSRVSVHLGNGNGTLGAAWSESPIPANTDAFDMEDPDHDGQWDFITSKITSGCCSAKDSVFCWHGNADGSLGARQFLRDFQAPVGIAAGDIGGDASADFVVMTELTHITSFVTQSPGSPPWRVIERSDYVSSYSPPTGPLLLADMNGDGVADIVKVNRGGGACAVFLGQGEGRFGGYSPAIRVTSANIKGASLADLDGDGITDLVYSIDANVGFGPARLCVERGRGDGFFESPREFLVPGQMGVMSYGPTALATGDVDGDGRIDVLVGSTGSKLHWFRNQGGGQLGPGIFIGTGPYTVTDIHVADLNVDGYPDVIDLSTVNNGGGPTYLGVFLGQAGGGFTGVAPLQMPNTYNQGMFVADFNRDGKPDFLYRMYQNGLCYLGNGNGTFTQKSQTPGGADDVGDIDGDGIVDLVYGNTTSTDGGVSIDKTTIGVLRGLGDGTFQALPVNDFIGLGLSGPVLRDLDLDGRLDLIAGSWVLNPGPIAGSYILHSGYGGLGGGMVAPIDGTGRTVVVRVDNGQITFMNNMAVPLPLQSNHAQDSAPDLTVTFAPVAPTPSRGLASLSFSLPEPAAVRLEVLDVSGRRLATLANQVLGGGPHTIVWRGNSDRGDAARPGVYLARLQAGANAFTQRIVWLR